MFERSDRFYMLRYFRRAMLRSRLTGTPLNPTEETKQKLIEMFGEEFYNKMLQLAQKPWVPKDLKEELGEKRYNEIRKQCVEEGKLDAWRLSTRKYPHTCDSKPHQPCMACFIVRTPEIKTVQ